MDKVATEFFWVGHAMEFKEGCTNFNATTGELLKITTLFPLVWETTGIKRSELTSEWPNWLVLLDSILIIVRESLETHVSDMLADLRELCMGSHEVALIIGEWNVSVVNWLEEVESIRMSTEIVQRESIASINSVSKELESC